MLLLFNRILFTEENRDFCIGTRKFVTQREHALMMILWVQKTCSLFVLLTLRNYAPFSYTRYFTMLAVFAAFRLIYRTNQLCPHPPVEQWLSTVKANTQL